MNKFIKRIIVPSFIFLSVLGSSIKAEKNILKIGAIPDQNQEILDRRFNLLAKELSKNLEVNVRYIPVVNYVAAVTGFRTKSLDLVWFGGLTGVQARLQTPNSIVIAQRDIDKEFKSVFIINKKFKLEQARNLNELQNLKKLRFTFGSENSTSGRLMPEYFLNEAGITRKDFKGGKTGFSGSHDATIALVNSGAFDSGALNKQIWDKTLINNPKITKNTKLFYVTPSYVDYHWLSQGNLDEKFYPGFTKKLKALIIGLDKNNTTHKNILSLFNASRFIDADVKQYNNIEYIGRKLKKIR